MATQIVIMRVMVRTQISLHEAEMERLRALARERGVSIASLLREAVDRLLDESTMDERWRRASAVIGKYSSGEPTNWAVDHDEAFVESILD